MNNRLFDCGCLRRGAPVRPWPDRCAKCERYYERECESQLWATVRTLAVLLVMAFFLVGACSEVFHG